MPLKIAVFVGSLRAESINRRLAGGLARVPSAQGHEFVFADIGSLPLYNQDHDDQPAPSVVALRELVKSSDGSLFVTPEYNRSIPGVLKNALDHGSRPWGQSVWKGIPAGVIGTSPGPIGTALAQSHLRMVLAYLDMPVMDVPEAYIQWKEDLVADNHDIHERSADYLNTWVKTFLGYVQRQNAIAAA